MSNMLSQLGTAFKKYGGPRYVSKLVFIKLFSQAIKGVLL